MNSRIFPRSGGQRGGVARGGEPRADARTMTMTVVAL